MSTSSKRFVPQSPHQNVNVEQSELTDAVSFLISTPAKFTTTAAEDDTEDTDFSFQSEDRTYSDDDDEEEEEGGMEEDELPPPVVIWRIPAHNPTAPGFNTFALDPAARETQEDNAYIALRTKEIEDEYRNKLEELKKAEEGMGEEEIESEDEDFEASESSDTDEEESEMGDAEMMDEEVEGLREERLEKMAL